MCMLALSKTLSLSPLSFCVSSFIIIPPPTIKQTTCQNSMSTPLPLNIIIQLPQPSPLPPHHICYLAPLTHPPTPIFHTTLYVSTSIIQQPQPTPPPMLSCTYLALATHSPPTITTHHPIFLYFYISLNIINTTTISTTPPPLLSCTTLVLPIPPPFYLKATQFAINKTTHTPFNDVV